MGSGSEENVIFTKIATRVKRSISRVIERGINQILRHLRTVLQEEKVAIKEIQGEIRELEREAREERKGEEEALEEKIRGI